MHSVDECRYRLQFVGGRLVYAEEESGCLVRRGSGRRVLTNFKHPVVGRLEEALRSAEMEVASAELLLDELDEAFVIRLSCTDSYDLDAEEAAGIRGYGVAVVAEYLEDRLKKMR